MGRIKDLLGGGDKKRRKKEALDYGRDMAIAEESRPNMMANQREAIASLGRSVYMIMHPDVDNMILKSRILRPMYPAYSHLMRVTKIGKLQAEILELDYMNLSLIVKMNMDEEEYESEGWLALNALEMFSTSIVSDAFQGFKAEVVTTMLKTIRTEVGEPKKEGRKLPF